MLDRSPIENWIRRTYEGAPRQLGETDILVANWLRSLLTENEHLKRHNTGMRQHLARYRKYIGGLGRAMWRVERWGHGMRQLPSNAPPVPPPLEPEAWPAYYADLLSKRLVGTVSPATLDAMIAHAAKQMGAAREVSPIGDAATRAPDYDAEGNMNDGWGVQPATKPETEE